MKIKLHLTYLFLLNNLIVFSQISPTFANINYCGDQNTKHLLDVFIPPSTTTYLPLVIHIHGGTFIAGQKGQALPQPNGPYYPPFTFCDSLYTNHYIIADINYRLASDSIFPALIYDIKTAVRFLKSNATLYHIDTCKVGIIGESTGGHLAAFLGTSNGIDSLEGYHLGSTHATSNVHAVLDMFGPTDFNYFDGYYPHILPDSCNPYPLNGSNDPNSPTAKILGCTVTNCPEKVKAINPITYVDGNEAAFRIYHGTFDCAVPFIQSTLLNDALHSYGEYSQLTLVPHAHHSDIYFYSEEFKDSILQFFNLKLKNDTSYCRSVISGVFNSEKNKSKFKIYPNPVTDQLTLQFYQPVSKSILIRIYDIQGNCKLNKTFAVQSNLIDIPVSDLMSSGIYFLFLTEGHSQMVQKFIKS